MPPVPTPAGSAHCPLITEYASMRRSRCISLRQLPSATVQVPRCLRGPVSLLMVLSLLVAGSDFSALHGAFGLAPLSRGSSAASGPYQPGIIGPHTCLAWAVTSSARLQTDGQGLCFLWMSSQLPHLHPCSNLVFSRSSRYSSLGKPPIGHFIPPHMGPSCPAGGKPIASLVCGTHRCRSTGLGCECLLLLCSIRRADQTPLSVGYMIFSLALRFGDLTGSFDFGKVVSCFLSVVGVWVGLLRDASLCCCAHKAVNTVTPVSRVLLILHPVLIHPQLTAFPSGFFGP